MSSRETRQETPLRASTARGSGYFPTRDVVDILGISRRQLQYWAKTDLVAPSATTPGGHRRYSFADLVALKTTKRLIDSGVSVQRIRESIRSLRERLPEIEVPLSDLVLVATGDVVLIFPASASYEAIAGSEWVFEVGAFAREVETWQRALDELPPRRARAVRRRSGEGAAGSEATQQEERPRRSGERESMQTG